MPPRKWQLAAFWRLLATLRGQMPPLTVLGRHDAADPELAPEDLWGLALVVAAISVAASLLGIWTAMRVEPNKVLS